MESTTPVAEPAAIDTKLAEAFALRRSSIQEEVAVESTKRVFATGFADGWNQAVAAIKKEIAALALAIDLPSATATVESTKLAVPTSTAKPLTAPASPTAPTPTGELDKMPSAAPSTPPAKAEKTLAPVQAPARASTAAAEATNDATLYGIPPPSAVVPIVPSTRKPPRPPYPPLPPPERHPGSGATLTTTPCPVIILVGPVSDAARADWIQGPRDYIQAKLRGLCRVGFCDLIDGLDGRCYAKVMFWDYGAVDKALAIFRAYPCGGSIMWSWQYQIVTYTD